MIGIFLFEPRHEKTSNVVSEQVRHKPSCKGTEDGLEAGNVGFRDYRHCTIREAKNGGRGLVTVKLICACKIFIFS